jgi:hypothetical protein
VILTASGVTRLLITGTHRIAVVSTRIEDGERRFGEVESRHLVSVVATKEQEKAQLEQVLGEQHKTSEALKPFTEEQKTIMADAVTSAQRQSMVVSALAVAGSLLLNIAATLIWTLLGNPGRDEIVQRFNSYLSWFRG